jgi:large subunit ribosomal protein L3
MKFILATKQRMTQLFDEKGRVTAGTVLAAGPVTVTAVRTADKDGYEAVQVGFGAAKDKHLTKAERGHQKDLALSRTLREFRGAAGEAKRGDIIDLTSFAPGDMVSVSALSKSKGFQGVVKRHGFAGGPRTHGQKHSEREPGSIATGRIQTVRKGKKMAGRMGGTRITVKNLKVLAVNPETRELTLSGAVPGRRGTLVEVREAAADK